MAIFWLCPKCKQGQVYHHKKVCPKCGFDSSRYPGREFYVEVNYKDEHGKRRRLRRKVPIPNATLQDAQKYELELKQKLKGESVLVKGKLPFSTFWEEEYIHHCRLHNSPSTVKRKQQVYEHWLKPYFGSKRLDAINKRSVEQFLVWRSQQLNKDSRGGMPTTNEIRHTLAVLKHALGLAAKWGYIDKNPASGVSVKPEDPISKRHFLTEEEIDRVVQHLPPPIRFLVQFMTYTGLRYRDAANLTWSQVDLENRVVKVKMEKTERVLVIPLCNKAVQALEEAKLYKKTRFRFCVSQSTDRQALHTDQ